MVPKATLHTKKSNKRGGGRRKLLGSVPRSRRKREKKKRDINISGENSRYLSERQVEYEKKAHRLRDGIREM